MELLERVSGSTWAFIKVLLALYIWVDIITDYMVVHAWKVLCDDDEKLNCLYWKLGLTFCLLPSIVFITFGILFAWWKGGLGVDTGLFIIAFGAFYCLWCFLLPLVIFPVVKLCATVFSLVRRCMGESTTFESCQDEDNDKDESEIHNATMIIGVFEAVFESLPQMVIQWHVIGSGLVEYADWGESPLNSWEMAVVSATVSTGSVIYNTARGLHTWYGWVYSKAPVNLCP